MEPLERLWILAGSWSWRMRGLVVAVGRSSGSHTHVDGALARLGELGARVRELVERYGSELDVMVRVSPVDVVRGAALLAERLATWWSNYVAALRLGERGKPQAESIEAKALGVEDGVALAVRGCARPGATVPRALLIDLDPLDQPFGPSELRSFAPRLRSAVEESELVPGYLLWTGRGAHLIAALPREVAAGVERIVEERYRAELERAKELGLPHEVRLLLAERAAANEVEKQLRRLEREALRRLEPLRRVLGSRARVEEQNMFIAYTYLPGTINTKHGVATELIAAWI